MPYVINSTYIFFHTDDNILAEQEERREREKKEKRKMTCILFSKDTWSFRVMEEPYKKYTIDYYPATTTELFWNVQISKERFFTVQVDLKISFYRFLTK